MATITLRRPRAKPARISKPTAAGSVLRASGLRVTVPEAAATRQYVQEWQSRALFYHDNIPEVHFASQFYERYLRSVRLFVARRDASGELEEVEEDHPATAYLDRIQDPGGGTSGWKGSYGRLKFLIGEGLLAQTEQQGGEAWEFLSPFELQPTGAGTYRRVSAPGISVEYQLSDGDADETVEGDELVAYRLWTPHPRWSRLADSPMLATLQVCEELLKLTDAVRARVVSRLAGNGVLFMPEGYSFTPPTTEGDENTSTDPFRDAFQEHALAPIEDPGTAAAVIPLIVWGNHEVGGRPLSEVIYHLKTHDPSETYPEEGLRTECVRRFALGADFPPEVLMGLSDANHWGAWVVDETTARAYIFPVCQQLCDDLTAAYFRRAVRDAEIADWEDLVIGYDAAGIVAHPDQSKNALEVYRLGELSGTGLREYTNVAEDFAPDDDDRDRWREWVSKGQDLADDAADESAGAQSAAEVEPGMPAEPDVMLEPPSGMTASSAAFEMRIVGAAEAGVVRCRALAGARLRSRSERSCGDCAERLDGVSQSLVASVLGSEQVRSFEERPDRELVAGGAEEFMTTVGGWGISDEHATRMGELIERHAAKTLYEERPSPLPVGFSGYVRRIPMAKAA